MIDMMGRNVLEYRYRIRHCFADAAGVSGYMCGNGVICWSHGPNEARYFTDGTEVFRHHFDPATTDCDPLVAYCEGHMPAYAFADWLEEQVSDFPPEGLAILRERAEGE